jgi:MoxR-like ATPase
MPTSPLVRFFDPEKIPGIKTFHFCDAELVTKINVAIAIGRPLLLTGQPGVGKSSVARGFVDAQNWAWFDKTITSRLDAADLKAEFDAVDRLSDASVNAARGKAHYMSPGVLWRAYDAAHAKAFLKGHDKIVPKELDDARLANGRVLLIDEIDKGDLEFANDLLDVFDVGKFDVPVINDTVTRKGQHDLLVVITSNGERDLPKAFQRRCIPHKMKASTLTDAVAIGRAHLTRIDKVDSPLLTDERLKELARFTASPSTAERDNPAIDVAQYVDLIDATLTFNPADADWPIFAAGIQSFAVARREAMRDGSL